VSVCVCVCDGVCICVCEFAYYCTSMAVYRGSTGRNRQAGQRALPPGGQVLA